MRIEADKKYRHEYKYLCSGIENTVIKTRVSGILQRDKYAEETGYYTVRSLYFDTPNNRCYFENEAGVDKRDKFRIRIYNADNSNIVLEKKSKKNHMVIKKSCPITKEMCEQLMRGKHITITEEITKEQRELLSELQGQAMRPVVIVEYTRYPFVGKNGNVRVTFDENIRSSNDIGNFWEENIITRPILPLGKSILEIKWDEFLPSYIKEHIYLESLQWTNFSKYSLCRKYNCYGGIRV